MYFRSLVLLFVFTTTTLNSAYGQSVVCPAVRTTSGWLDLFPLPCAKHADCQPMGARHLCCKGYCTKGVKKAAAIRSNESAASSVAPSSSSSTSTTIPSTTIAQTTTTSSTSTTTTSTTTPSTTTSSTTSTTTPRPTTTSTSTTRKPAPTTTQEPPRPFLQILPLQTTQAPPVKKASANVKTSNKSKSAKQTPQKFVCPKPGQAPLLLFPIPCEKTSQCRASGGADEVCCDRRCVRGVPAPRPTTPAPTHQPLLGVIPRECPAAPLGELLFEVQTCKSDADCWPRVCCPDGKRSYCRTARARLDLVPGANAIDRPVRMLEQYVQCTPPPQYDLFPQKCASSVDCFPNLCCAEGGARHCRPPQRSLIALLAGVGQRVGSTIGNLRQAQTNANQNQNQNKV